ncbi:alanine--tRNA ligase [Pseudobacter ginsenosidimutans]|uniref:Alanine--tRNA ligase n=1 Tax=Pseudobacter ginsenosidimutans TaxID=661488 RepID=A0A4Q7MRG2_9BACT|nr:alanine--tRNA ligase [Pseudobacter ginsenosidimutans]QEC41848.1 alanine--tRNA ligase [Pseudobacter ginsenosidimutans]RZS71335.1 alanyl-tRNA synthetase [Pseudobacter ginsenosidimutans]
MITSAAIRQHFLDFFKSKGHTIVPSAPIVLKNDPTLLFTNAGMNQFKDYFLGNKQAPHKRVADTQKCLRVSGKHNDLEEVGVDTYHHTMFEMLGNWSFGDYFKTEAIAWSWELLNVVFQIPKDRLYVTVFEGDPELNLPKDEEAMNEWKKWVAEDRILLGKKKDNFWEMGDTGPCGPCTEIHVDCRSDEERAKSNGASLVNNDHPQVIEIWNNVFIQFNRLKDGSLEPLPAKHVDTGMGFERLVRVLQGKQSNYDTDVFSETIAATGNIVHKKYDGSDSRQAIAFRVIADHIRAISFTIADGQLPSNTGAGYVIRRILRRAVRYYYSYLDYKQPLLHQLLPVIAHQFRDVFPELQQQQDFVKKVIREEEEAFLRTLDKGLKRIDDVIKTATNGTIEGSVAFELYDTYGFPIDLTLLIARENNLAVDEKGFEKEMQQQKDRSRAATTLDTEDWVQLVKDGKENQSPNFAGYDMLELQTKVLKYRKIKAKGKESYQLVLNTTPFYAESGGQVGDTGFLSFDGEMVPVTDTKKENDLIIHFTDKLPVNITAPVDARVDAERRKCTAVHHSATHLLHAALRKVLGTHVAQKGSLVNEEYLRFDFSHFAKMTDEEISKVEAIVNQKIRENIPVVIKEMPKEEAMQSGAMALFGEKYADVVRVVIIDPNYSVELCGGTHVGSTGEIGIFRIKQETAVAAGVRRVEAVSGYAAEKYIDEQSAELKQVKLALKNPKDAVKAVEQLQSENSDLKKKLDHLENRILVGVRNELLQKDQIIDGVTYIGEIIEVGNADALKKLAFDLKNNLHDYVAVLCANIGGKPFVAVGISDTVVAAKQLDAGKIIKEHIAPLIKGGGGGQKNLATAGGQDASQLQAVIEKVKGLL